MIYKSYEIEKKLENVNSKMLLFYGENLGLKNYFKRKIKFLNKNYQFINLVQDDLMQNQNLLFNEINNTSLFEDKKILTRNGRALTIFDFNSFKKSFS